MYSATIPNRNSPLAILLRQACRENGKAKHRTLANLSHWQPARIEALRRALRGEFDQAALSTAPALGPIFGPLYVLKQIADALGITAALRNGAAAARTVRNDGQQPPTLSPYEMRWPRSPVCI